VDWTLATSDDTISAVALLAIADATGASPASAKIHRNGLDRLIQIRKEVHVGDIKSLPLRLVRLATLLTSGMGFQPGDSYEARKSSTDSTFPLVPATTNCVAPQSWSAADRAMAGDFRVLHLDVRDMFNELTYLSILITDIYFLPQQQAVNKKAVLTHKLYQAEQHLNHLFHSEAQGDRSCEDPLFTSRAYPIAGRIFLDIYLRDIPLESSTFDYQVARLQYALIETDLENNDRMYPPEARFWVLVIGGLAALGRPQEHWFRKHGIKSRENLCLNSWKGALHVLKKFPLAGPRYESLCQNLWAQLA